MENEHISQFEDQPVIADSVFDYTDALRAESVPVVIDNGKILPDIVIKMLLYYFSDCARCTEL